MRKKARRPDYQDRNVSLYLGDCTEVLPYLDSQSSQASISDPPYPEITRDYGRWTEDEWQEFMRAVVSETRRLLTKRGTAMYVLQPNSAHVGEMRLWLWEFVAWAARDWNLIQDTYWFNNTALPTVHCQRQHGLMRPSVKHCVWLGSPDCFRDQDAVLLPLSEHIKQGKKWAPKTKPSGHQTNDARMAKTALERGGTTPFNLLRISNGYTKDCAGAFGHGAGTPFSLCDWWVRYLTKRGEVVLDPFMGTGTTGLAAIMQGRRFIGIEKDEKYFKVAVQRFRRLGNAGAQTAA